MGLSEKNPADPSDGARERNRLILAIAVIAIAGLCLRIAAAQGALWLDEAWSATFAREAGDPAHILFGINHDNNHPLNTLWLAVTGWGAPPMLSRGLSILSGTAMVVVGGLIGARRGLPEAVVVAALLAISPILVIYGSEARGYVPMLLALVMSIDLVDRWLSGGASAAPARRLGMLALLGTLAHLTFVFGLGAILLRVAATLARRMPPGAAARETGRAMGRAGAAAIAVVLIMVVAAVASPSGFRVGSYTPFSAMALIDGFGEMLQYAVGATFVPGPLLIISAAVLLAASAVRASRPRISGRSLFYLVAIFGPPCALALLRVGNSGFARYYLVPATLLLLLLGETLAAGLRAGGWRRALAAVLVSVFGAGSLWLDARMIADRRADPGLAIVAMVARAPGGATVIVDSMRNTAVVEAAAASAHFPVRVTGDICAAAQFLFVDGGGQAPFPARIVRCEIGYRRVAVASPRGLSGVGWELFEPDIGIRPDSGASSGSPN